MQTTGIGAANHRPGRLDWVSGDRHAASQRFQHGKSVRVRAAGEDKNVCGVVAGHQFIAGFLTHEYSITMTSLQLHALGPVPRDQFGTG